MIENTFSTSLYNVCKQYMLSQNVNIDNVGYVDIVNTTRELLFNFDYLIYDNADVAEHKRNIEELFVSEYLFDDLGVYSFGEWLLHFRIAFQQTIEKFNPIWKMNDKYSDYLFANDISITEDTKTTTYGKKSTDDYTKKTDGEQNGKREYDNSRGGDVVKSKNVYYDTPQDEINEPAYDGSGNPIYINGNVAVRQYATNMSKDEQETIRNSIEKSNVVTDDTVKNNGSTTLSGKDINEHIINSYGVNSDKLYYQILNDMREAFLPIDLSFVKDNNFKELFSPILM